MWELKSVKSFVALQFPITSVFTPRFCRINLRFASQPLPLHPMASPSWSACATPWCWPGNSQLSSEALTSPVTLWITVRSSMACRESGTRPTSRLLARGPTGWVDMKKHHPSLKLYVLNVQGASVFVSLFPGVRSEGE